MKSLFDFVLPLFFSFSNIEVITNKMRYKNGFLKKIFTHYKYFFTFTFVNCCCY